MLFIAQEALMHCLQYISLRKTKKYAISSLLILIINMLTGHFLILHKLSLRHCPLKAVRPPSRGGPQRGGALLRARRNMKNN